MFLAANMVLIGIFAGIGFLACITVRFKGGFGSCGVSGSLRRKDFVVEDFGRDWWEGGDTALEIVSAVTSSVHRDLKILAIRGTYCQSLLM